MIKSPNNLVNVYFYGLCFVHEFYRIITKIEKFKSFYKLDKLFQNSCFLITTIIILHSKVNRYPYPPNCVQIQEVSFKYTNYIHFCTVKCKCSINSQTMYVISRRNPLIFFDLRNRFYDLLFSHHYTDLYFLVWSVE